MNPCLPGLFTPRVHPIADTSLAAYARILPTLTDRERAVFLALCDEADANGLTGGELAERMGLPVTSVRPRLTGLYDKGWIGTLPARKSRVAGEGACHPYFTTIPRAAVERGQ